MMDNVMAVLFEVRKVELGAVVLYISRLYAQSFDTLTASISRSSPSYVHPGYRIGRRIILGHPLCR